VMHHQMASSYWAAFPAPGKDGPGLTARISTPCVPNSAALDAEGASEKVS
jgi:hypothetical protein